VKVIEQGFPFRRSVRRGTYPGEGGVRVRELFEAVVAIGSGLGVGVALTDSAALIPYGGGVTGIGSFRADRLNRLSARVD
jgi:hypothetical protein